MIDFKSLASVESFFQFKGNDSVQERLAFIKIKKVTAHLEVSGDKSSVPKQIQGPKTFSVNFRFRQTILFSSKKDSFGLVKINSEVGLNNSCKFLQKYEAKSAFKFFF